MSPYYQQGPEDYYGPQGNFDPYSGRLQSGNLIMQFLQNLQRQRDENQQREWAGEDRDLRKRLTEAQISNYMEVPATKEPAQKGYKVPPATLKEVANYYGFPEKEWGEYDPEMQKDMVNKYLTAKGGRTRPIKPATTKGAMQSRAIDSAAKRIEGFAKMYEGAATQLMSNPMAGILAGGKVEEYQRVSEAYRKAGTEIEAMKGRIDEEGELSEQDYARLQSMLKVPESIRTSAVSKGSPSKGAPATTKTTVVTKTEETIPPDVLAAAKKARPDLTEQEIIAAWKARKK